MTFVCDLFPCVIYKLSFFFFFFNLFIYLFFVTKVCKQVPYIGLVGMKNRFDIGHGSRVVVIFVVSDSLASSDIELV